ncbi:hypothetical protein SISSUDRAFT_1051028 [Sistotremastrum suecicum HHB10207 ss-3]|uniref:Uncharacterized protein n=1 Tax=Sistotremastrum suecicum HHB10207 ss-3 TaxID=1314776 RepID=A0A166AUJ3_9AGAM|nr:hypothetical protein SISSUDRAFT_1051028 [Sistotremastrum suecicum HHB10207 ss-3]
MAVSAMYTNPNNTRAEVMAQCELQTGTASSIDPSSSHPALIHVILEQENQQPDLRNIDSSAKECGCDLHNPVKKCPEHEYQLESERLALQELRDAFDPSENLPEDEDAFLAFVAQRIRCEVLVPGVQEIMWQSARTHKTFSLATQLRQFSKVSDRIYLVSSTISTRV